jgi:hypothetical protein
MKEKIQQLIELMSSKNYEELHAVLEGYSVKELEKLVIRIDPSVWWMEEAIEDKLWKLIQRKWKLDAKFVSLQICSIKAAIEDKLQKLILQHRKGKLDAEFVFSPENKAKILHADKQLIEGQKKLYQEAEKEIMYLEKKQADKKTFIDLSEMVCWIEPLISAKDDTCDPYDPVGRIFVRTIDRIDWILKFTEISKCRLFFEGETCKESHTDEYFDKKQNWNNYDMPIKVEWDDFYISDGMYELCGRSLFSLSDVIRINSFQCTVNTKKHGWVQNF